MKRKKKNYEPTDTLTCFLGVYQGVHLFCFMTTVKGHVAVINETVSIGSLETGEINTVLCTITELVHRVQIRPHRLRCRAC